MKNPAPLDEIAASTPSENGLAPLILAADTTTPRIGLAITRGETLLASISSLPLGGPAPHSRTFFSHLETLFDLAGTAIDKVELLAVTSGPGSFTGLRVGLSAMKALASSLNRPLHGVDLFDIEALATGLALPVLVLLEAGRDEIFCGLRTPATDGDLSAPGRDNCGQPLRAITSTLSAAPPPRLLITGNGVNRCLPALQSLANSHRIACSSTPIPNPDFDGWQILQSRPLTASLPLLLALRALRLARDGRPPLSAPLYLRPSDAELNLVLK